MVSGQGSGSNNVSGFLSKLGFVVWGVRYFDIVLVAAYPSFGAVLALPDLAWSSLVRFAAFTFFNVLYIAHIFIYNDWCDARLNPEEPKLRDRHVLKRPVLSDREILGINAALILVSFIGFFIISLHLFFLVAIIELITYFYSQRRINLKGIPVVSLSIHFAFGFLYVLGGWVVFREFTAAGFFLASYIGLVMVAGHFENEIDDFEQDFAVGIRTNAVAFGQRAVLRAGQAIFLLSSAWFVVGSWLWLKSPAYTWLGVFLLVAWLIQTFRYRHWRGGDSIKEFRRFYRAAYASFTLALFLIKFIELIKAA